MDNLTKLPTIGWVRENWQEFKDALPKVNTLLYFDVDTLTCVNDLFGMEESDNRLILTADTIRKNVPDDYPVVRFSGDEFVALVNNSKFTEQDFKSLISLLDDPSYKITVDYSNIDHYSVSGCMIRAGEIDSFEMLGYLTDQALEAIRNKKVHLENRKYKFQGIATVVDAT